MSIDTEVMAVICEEAAKSTDPERFITISKELHDLYKMKRLTDEEIIEKFKE